MRTTITNRFIGILIASLFIFSLNAQNIKIEASGNYITKDISATNFDIINLAGSTDVSYTQSTDGTTKVQIYGSDNLIDLLEVKVEGHTLNVKMKKNVSINFNRKGRLKVIASSPSLQEARLQGSGDIYIESPINSKDLLLSLKGSGDIHVKQSITCHNLRAELNGSGDIEVKGNINAGNVDLEVKGSGDIKTNQIKADATIAKLNGSGDIAIKDCISGNLTANLKGSGDVKIEGIEAGGCVATLQGSGDIQLAGKATNTTLHLQNSGDIKADKLVSENVHATINGSGVIKCHAVDNLTTNVSGSGSVRYKGKPVITNNDRRKENVRPL